MSRTENSGESAASSAAQQAQAALGNAATQASQHIRDLGGQAREAVTQGYQNLRDQAVNYYEEGRTRANEWEQGLEQTIQEKPLQSVLIAAGVGVLLGILLKR